jgi:hypothetical protein
VLELQIEAQAVVVQVAQTLLVTAQVAMAVQVLSFCVIQTQKQSQLVQV